MTLPEICGGGRLPSHFIAQRAGGECPNDNRPSGTSQVQPFDAIRPTVWQVGGSAWRTGRARRPQLPWKTVTSRDILSARRSLGSTIADWLRRRQRYA